MKVDQQLLEQVILEVIGRLTAKPKLLLVHDGKQKREKIELIVSELQEHWQVSLFNTSAPTEDQRIDTVKSHPMDRFHEFSQKPCKDPLEEPFELQHIAFLDVDQDLIVRGALGLTDTPASGLLAKALREGCPVLLEPSKDMRWLLSTRDQAGSPQRAERYREHLLQYKNTLVKLGAWFGKITAWRPSELRVDRKLLTEKDILNMALSGIREIRVSSSTIITHLARDAARKKGIRIRVDEESS